MATEKTIRKRVREKLLEEGWFISFPNRSRYGTFINYWQDGKKRGDDFFNLFDFIAWKDNKILLGQFTSTKDNTSAIRYREKKIKNKIEKHDLKIPEGVIIEIWGYKDYEGFTHRFEIDL